MSPEADALYADRAVNGSRHLTRITRLLGIGGLVAILTAIAGWGVVRTRLGGSEQAALERVQREVRSRFEREATELRSIVDVVDAQRDLLVAAPTSESALRALFDAADQALARTHAPFLAVSVFDAGGDVLAWGGRPSELPADRVKGPESLFVAPGPLGPRLVFVSPVVDSGESRLATIVGERTLGEALRPDSPAEGGFMLNTSLAPVSLRTRYEGAGEGALPGTFVVTSPTGETLLSAHVSSADLAQTRRTWLRATFGLALTILAVSLLLCSGPLVDLRTETRSPRQRLAVSAALIALVLGVRSLLWLATPPETIGWSIFSPSTYASSLFPGLLRSPADLVLTAATLTGILAVIADWVEYRRLIHRFAVHPGANVVTFIARQLLAGVALTGLVVGYQRFLQDTLANSTVDVLHFSIHPWDPARLALDFGLILVHVVTIWAGVLLLRALSPRRRFSRAAHPLCLGIFWILPAVLLMALIRPIRIDLPVLPTTMTITAILLIVWTVRRLFPRLRRASQAARLIAGFLALAAPPLVMYPTLLHFAVDAKRHLIEAELAPEASQLRNDLLVRLRQSKAQIDQMPELPDLIQATATSTQGRISTDAAYAIWSRTDLGRFRLTSAVELYSSEGTLVSRFALNLPEDDSATPRWRPRACAWNIVEESVTVGTEDRRVLRSGRLLCDPTALDGTARERRGAVALHVMLDYNALPFITSQSPYFELFRTDQSFRQEGVLGRDVEFVVYGWGRMPIHSSSGVAWALDDPLFERIASSRSPFWTTLDRGERRHAVYFTNDRAGIYALGYPIITWLGHLVNLAEITTLAAVGYVVLLGGASLLALIGVRSVVTGRALLREIRSSFYRKLFLAFVAASIVPVLALAFVTRAYSAGQLRDGIEAAAVRTAEVARRVVERYVSLQQRGGSTLPAVSDDVLVGLSAVIDQHVNIFDGAYLMATSERDLFASGLLPIRTPASVYRAVLLERRSTFVGDEQIGDFRYLLAATPVETGHRGAMLTVPLALRQQEIEREIDELDRRVLLAALVFILFGAFVGYSMAERIADPVNRLTRATRRIARGELSARIALRSSDELGRLVEAFNSMAADLARQRAQLERTHRLEAWAEMARQVAHDIKNPLTPIQLSAEHLVRVHADRGRPLAPVLDECVNAILGQVRLLRQISAEFSSFAASPTPQVAATTIGDLIDNVIAPYRAGLGDRIQIVLDVPPSVPAAMVDRTLVSRALTNVIENALSAMPATGSLSIQVRETARGSLVIIMKDSGAGMDADALRRAFEPYFSTKASGTGLGLAIAKRNIEASGGTIALESERGQGTTVSIELPLAK